MCIRDRCRKVTGHPIPTIAGARRAGDPPELVADATLAKEILGWEPVHRNPESIIASAWKWHQANPQGYKSTVSAEVAKS